MASKAGQNEKPQLNKHSKGCNPLGPWAPLSLKTFMSNPLILRDRARMIVYIWPYENDNHVESVIWHVIWYVTGWSDLLHSQRTYYDWIKIIISTWLCGPTCNLICIVMCDLIWDSMMIWYSHLIFWYILWWMICNLNISYVILHVIPHVV